MTEQELHELIMHHAELIKLSLIQVRDKESAQRAVKAVRINYDAINNYLAQQHDYIRTRGYHLARIKQSSRETTRLFGTISILALDLLKCDAYGSEDLAKLLSNFCPPSYYQSNLANSDQVSTTILSQELRTPSSFIRAENMLHQLHHLLKVVQNRDLAALHTTQIRKLIDSLLEVDEQVRYILENSSEREVELIHQKLAHIRHLSALCYSELNRIEEAGFYKVEPLRNTIANTKRQLSHPLLVSSNKRLSQYHLLTIPLQ